MSSVSSPRFVIFYLLIFKYFYLSRPHSLSSNYGWPSTGSQSVLHTQPRTLGGAANFFKIYEEDMFRACKGEVDNLLIFVS